jgi:hypothetical protein
MTLVRDGLLVSLIVIPTLLSLAGREPAPPAAPGQQPYAHHAERGLARVVWFSGNGLAGEIWMDYGRPAWNDTFNAEVEKPANKRWRFGADVWTSFESFVSLKAAGVSVPAGHYYAILEHPAKGKWNLVLLDQKEIRAKKMDAFSAAQTTGGIAIPLTAGTGDLADRLTIKMSAEESKPKDVALEIAFGKHRFTAPLKVDV